MFVFSWLVEEDTNTLFTYADNSRLLPICLEQVISTISTQLQNASSSQEAQSSIMGHIPEYLLPQLLSKVHDTAVTDCTNLTYMVAQKGLPDRKHLCEEQHYFNDTFWMSDVW